MSAYVLDQSDINVLTAATDAALRMNAKYPGSYPLNDDTVTLLGRFAGDLHSIYRALYIANIRAVNGRYNEDQKTMPKYKPLHAWDIERIWPDQFKKAATTYHSYMYQCSEDPVYNSRVYRAFYDIYKLICMVYMQYMDY